MSYTAYALNSTSRAKILTKFMPKFPDVICHHITQNFGVPENTKFSILSYVTVVGYINDDSLETLVVEVDGRRNRPDGKTYHITLSLDKSKGRRPSDSNMLISNSGYDEIDPFYIGMMHGKVFQ